MTTPPQPVRRLVLGAPRPVKVLVLGVFVNRVGSFFAAFVVLFLNEKGFSPAQLPLVLLAIGVAMPVGALLGGWAADRYSHKAILVVSSLLAGASLALLAVASGRASVVVGAVAVALCAQAYLPAAAALIIDHTAERDRIPTFALYRLALNVGAALGPVVAAVVVASHGLQLLFLVDALSYAVFAVLLGLALPPRRPPAADRSAAETAGEMLYAPVVNAAVAALSPADQIGRYQGYLTTAQAIGFAGGPALGAWLFTISPAVLWTGCLAVGALAAASVGLARGGPASGLGSVQRELDPGGHRASV